MSQAPQSDARSGSRLQADARSQSQALQHDVARLGEMLDAALCALDEIEQAYPAESLAGQAVARAKRHCAGLMAEPPP